MSQRPGIVVKLFRVFTSDGRARDIQYDTLECATTRFNSTLVIHIGFSSTQFDLGFYSPDRSCRWFCCNAFCCRWLLESGSSGASRRCSHTPYNIQQHFTLQHRGIGAQLHSHRGIGFLNPFPTSIVSDLEYFLDIILGSLITLDSHRHSLIVDSPIHITVVDDPGFGSLTQSHLGIGSHDSFPNPQVL
jgi:hypothetical protein